MPLNLKVSGVWKTITPYLRVSGVWKTAQLWLKVSGVWKLVSNVFNQPDGNYSDYNGIGGTAQVTLTANIPVTWTYTGGGIGVSVSIASGATATSITFTANGDLTPGTSRGGSWTVTGNGGGQTGNYTVNVDSETP